MPVMSTEPVRESSPPPITKDYDLDEASPTVSILTIPSNQGGRLTVREVVDSAVFIVS